MTFDFIQKIHAQVGTCHNNDGADLSIQFNPKQTSISGSRNASLADNAEKRRTFFWLRTAGVGAAARAAAEGMERGCSDTCLCAAFCIRR